ncbi:MAG: aminopeptidase [Candidatus Hydrothermia bacterium]
MEFKNAWNSAIREDVFKYSENYKEFLSTAKTEREVVDFFLKLVKESSIPPEDLLTFNFRNKCLVIYRRGNRDVKEGLKIVAAHIDAPRIDVKQNPLYEDSSLALLETHYYGGIKKYQWVARPLALHGVIVKRDGTIVDISIGEKPGDPVFTFTDILPHLSRNVQANKTISEAIHGEKLDLLVGNIPLETDDEKVKEKIKENVIKILKEKYGIEEKDFVSAELEIVPSGPALDVGIDGSLIGGYGQDDRVCAYTAVTALLHAKELEKHSLVVLYDKEEIGSDGNTGAQSEILEYVVSKILEEHGLKEYSTLREILFRSEAISGDVTAGVDPNWKEVHELKNAAFMGHGVAISKYTGSGGKYSTNDAHAEFVAKIIRAFDEEKVAWQVAELGRVDEGGGGTVAKYLSKLGIDTIDVGPPLLSMHSPFEIASKVDVYMTYKAYQAFLKSK